MDISLRHFIDSAVAESSGGARMALVKPAGEALYANAARGTAP